MCERLRTQNSRAYEGGFMKNDREIEEMAEREFPTIMWSNAAIACAVMEKQTGFKKGYSQAQKDLLESASKGFEGWIYKTPNKCDLRDFEKPNHNYFVARESWNACELKNKSEKDSLKDQILRYESDLRDSRKIIQDKSEYIFQLKKSLDEKDQKINDFYENNQKIIKSLERMEEKYDQAANDIVFLISHARAKSNYSTREFNFELGEIRKRHGISEE